MSSGWGAEGNFDLKIIESFGRYVNCGWGELTQSKFKLLSAATYWSGIFPEICSVIFPSVILL